jgi:hypothetical protein
MKQDNHDGENRWTGFAAAIFVTILMTVLLNYPETQKRVCSEWGDDGKLKDASCLFKYIFEFQTLITGILAVGAAYFTVKQMRETDRLAERRHNEQMDIHKLPIKLKVERTIIPALRYFDLFGGTFVSTYNRLCSEEAPLKDRLLDYQREAIIVLRTAQALQYQLDAKEWKDVTDLFGANINGQFEQAKMGIATLVSSADIITKCQISETIPRGDAMADKELEIITYPINLLSAQQALNEFSDELKALAKRYGVDTSI